MDIKDFLNRAKFRYDPHFGIVAEFDGQDYEVTPDGEDTVRVVGSEGETLGRLGFLNGNFVPA